MVMTTGIPSAFRRRPDRDKQTRCALSLGKTLEPLRQMAFNKPHDRSFDGRDNSMTAEYKVHGDVAVITMPNNPPVNGWSWPSPAGHGGRPGAGQCRCRRQSHRHHRRGGKAFSGGADIKEFGTDKSMAEPNLHPSFNAVANQASRGGCHSQRVHGRRAGAGAGLPLPHRRAGCKVALPEVKLGLMPGAGGTQRLPRVVGEAALNMIVSGEP